MDVIRDVTFKGFPHIIKSQQFSVEFLETIFYLANQIESNCNGNDILKGQKMITFFYEPSTRTRASFEIAMDYLGGKVVFSTENAKEFSSGAKGETIEDTIKVLCGYKPDVIVLRYHEEGGAERAAKVSSVPIINAGDGRGQHPTQTLTDLYTIKKRFCYDINGFSIAMVGDLKNGRTVRSLSYLLGKFKSVKIYFVSPQSARMKDDVKGYLYQKGINFQEETDLRNVAGKVNVIYQTRIQKERGTNEDDFNSGYFTVDKNILDLMKKDAIVMHPLPRNDEIMPEVDQDPRAVYFEQAENGLYVRMALLKMILAPNKNL